MEEESTKNLPSLPRAGSDLRFIRVIVTVLFLAFALMIGLNSAQSFIEQHGVETAENFGALIRATTQIGTASQRLSLITFASFNPPEKDLRTKLSAEVDGEIQQISDAVTQISATLVLGRPEHLKQKSLDQLHHMQRSSEQFIKLAADLRNQTQSETADVSTVGAFANKTSDLLAESRIMLESLSVESVRTAQNNQNLRKDIFLASSAATILTAAIVLFFIVYRLRLELSRRSQVEERLLKSNEELENFSAIVAHDLKGPLNNIALSVEMLNQAFSADPESQKKLFNIILKETDHLRGMIEALLRLSRLGTKKIEIQPFNLKDLIKETENSLRSKLEEVKGTVSYHGIPLIWADRLLIGNLFQNLIENSIKYRNGKPPDIKILGWLSKDITNFTYEDNGLGIPEAQRDTVFNAFVQADSHYDGLGLGLSVVKKIIAAHGGAIRITEKPDPGTRFEFSIARRSKAFLDSV